MSEAMRKRSKIEAGRREQLALGLTAACSVALSGGVIASLIYLLLALASLMAARPAFAQSAPVGAGVRLEAGIEKEDVDGDLKSAMDIYQKIATDTAAPRDVRAKALLRLAGCDEKLGKQAKQIYEQIVRDYADQPPAAQARKRLALIKQQEHPAQPATMTARKIETSGLGKIDTWDTDGQRAVYRGDDGSLYFGDLAGHSKRLVLKAEAGDSLEWQPSIDFSMVSLKLQPNPKSPATLAVVNIDGTGYRELIHDDAHRTILGWDGSLDFSWDKRYLLLSATGSKVDSSQLYVVSVADGQRRDLARTDGGWIWRAAFSPDGRFVAYSVMPVLKGAKNVSCSIFVIPSQGGEPHQVYKSRTWQAPDIWDANALLDWTANGRFLAIKDIEDGRSALYLLPMKDGAAAGPAEMVRYGDFLEAFTTASGALVYREKSAKPVEEEVFLAPLNSDGHVESWRRVDVRGSRYPDGDTGPSFSPSGSEIAYTASDKEAGKTDLILRELSNGQERVLYQSVGHLLCQFASLHQRIFCTDSESYDKTELISIAVESGSVERLGSVDGKRWILQHDRDDAKLYFLSDNYPALGSILEWDIAAHKETALATHSDYQETYHPSRDGNWLVRTRLDSGLDSEISLRPMSGGDWKSLASGINRIWWQNVVAPDSKWVYYHSIDQAGKQSLFRVSMSGGEPKRLGDFPDDRFSGQLDISPDGRQILATCLGYRKQTDEYDLWIFDDFLPPAKK